MMCILGKHHPRLVAGQVYEVTISQLCCRPAAYAEGSVFKRPLTIICLHCFNRCGRSKLVPWGPWRFIPLDDDVKKELLQESNDLYKSDKEKQNA